MRGEILGVERRRRWSDEEKLAIVTSVGIDGATVTRVVQHHDVTRQLIYGWRYELKRKGLWSPNRGAVFLPADLPAADVSVEELVASLSVPVELRLANGRCLRFPSDLDARVLTRHAVKEV
ncbi:transposase [Leisingera caerulea]|uniref:transposase n=1 Tax=Leisingera caerulea TaxID=506591 RepID=UPI0021A5B5D6|nr:transposase [Leisingera caerulea]UWQ85036.1 transposase [Leisingera caerulea]